MALLGLKANPKAGQGKMKISVHLLRSPWVGIYILLFHGTQIILYVTAYFFLIQMNLFALFVKYSLAMYVYWSLV